MRKQRESGFTLVELLTVVGILGVLATTLASGLSRSIPIWRVRQAAVEIGSTLRAARAKAMLDHADFSVPFDTSRNRYTVLRGSGVEKVNVDSGGTLVASLPTGVVFAHPSGSTSITVDPPGSESEAAKFSSRGLLRSDNLPGYIYVGNPSRGVYWRVSVNSIGTVRVEKWTGSQWI